MGRPPPKNMEVLNLLTPVLQAQEMVAAVMVRCLLAWILHRHRSSDSGSSLHLILEDLQEEEAGEVRAWNGPS